MAITNFSNKDWMNEVALYNTQVRWDYAELKNGFNPAHEWYATGEGCFVFGSTALSKLDSPNKKYSYRFTAPVSKGVNGIGLIPYAPTNAPNYTVSIQSDNGTGCPDGNKLAEGTIVGADAAHDTWYFHDLNQTLNLIKGNVYHIVIEYKNGTIDSDHYWKSNAMRPQINWTVGNYGGYDNNVDTPDSMMAGLYYTSEWHSAECSPIFLLKFIDGTTFGQPYRHSYINIEDNYRARQYFVVRNQNKTVTELTIRAFVKYQWCNESQMPPYHSIYYWIKNSTGDTLRSGTIAHPEEAEWGVSHWYSDTLSSPLELEKDQTYIIELWTPDRGDHCGWTIEASDAYEETEAFWNATWNGGDGYVVRSNNNGSTWPLYDFSRDIPFKLKLQEVFEGNLTLVEKDAEGDVWKQIKFEGSVPSGTSVDIAVNSPSCGGFVTVQNNAISDVTYDLPSCAQERYASWRFVLHTNNISITPEIYNVTFISGASVTGTISGIVTDKPTGLPISGVKITANGHYTFTE